ncbi:MAG: A/G-specific adenine glycosylase [Bauldia sp.]|nr:A/G-specific adenine glycosylase [Bauldia sp.]
MVAASNAIAPRLLAWYDRHARRLLWRVPPAERAVGVVPDPYRVWLSEVMLQQTTVAAVKSYFEAFVARWPTVADLAAAPREAVMQAWAGLGYYSRARNLHDAARAVVATHGGRFPDTADQLQSLPGVGAYTAAAIAAIAFDRPEPVVDGNIERVVARLLALETALPAAKPAIRAAQAELTLRERPGDFAQAMMDLGATICTPKRPACPLCPINEDCRAFALGRQEDFPVKAAKADRPTRVGTAFVAVRTDGAVLLRRRAEKGLLGGMVEVPGSAWIAKGGPAGGYAGAPFDAPWRSAGRVVHVFTHFRLELAVHHAGVGSTAPTPADHWWAPAESLPGEALPSLMKKVIEAAIPGATKRPGKSR